LAHREIEIIRLGGSSFFRPSASKDPHEFFAVALEAFFERSVELKEYNANLYQALVFLLKQDPLNLS
jgi:Mlc titration factor MtfA (ptsG expression regulator)